MIEIAGYYLYWMIIGLMLAGFAILIHSQNLIKKLVGLNIFQTSVFLFYIGSAKIIGGTAPILHETSQGLALPAQPISNPLPHVLILTAIVVGVATLALALALIIKIKEEWGTIEQDDLLALEEKRRKEE